MQRKLKLILQRAETVNNLKSEDGFFQRKRPSICSLFLFSVIIVLAPFTICTLIVICQKTVCQSSRPRESTPALDVSVRCDENGRIYVDVCNRFEEDVYILRYISLGDGTSSPLPHLKLKIDAKTRTRSSSPIAFSALICCSRIEPAKVLTIEPAGIYVEPIDLADYLSKTRHDFPLVIPYTLILHYEVEGDSQHPMRDAKRPHFGEAVERLIGVTESTSRRVGKLDDEMSPQDDLFDSLYRTIKIDGELRIEK